MKARKGYPITNLSSEPKSWLKYVHCFYLYRLSSLDRANSKEGGILHDMIWRTHKQKWISQVLSLVGLRVALYRLRYSLTPRLTVAHHVA